MVVIKSVDVTVAKGYFPVIMYSQIYDYVLPPFLIM